MYFAWTVRGAVYTYNTAYCGSVRKKNSSATLETIYYRAWASLQRVTDGKLSNGYLTDALIAHGQRRVMLAHRTGTLWHKGRALMMKLSDNNRCPLYDMQDGNSHLVAGCQHASMTRCAACTLNATLQLPG